MTLSVAGEVRLLLIGRDNARLLDSEHQPGAEKRRMRVYFLMQLSLTFTGTNQRGIEKKRHITLHFYNKFETKHQETLSAPAKLIPIKAPGSVPAVLLPQIAQGITRFMKHSKVKYPININMQRNQLFYQFSAFSLSPIQGGLIAMFVSLEGLLCVC